MEHQEWETSKENVLPLKQGRSATTLNQALQNGTPQRNPVIEEKVNEFERGISDYLGSDPLLPWISYIKWMKENSPTDATAYIRLMERCLQKFTDSPLYLKDARFLQIWILYINTQDFQSGKQIFAFMRSHHIGTSIALFYLAESLLHEENGDYETTEHIYQEGITNCAQPLDVLKRNQHQFHRRMRRKCINHCKEKREKGELPDPILAPVETSGITMPAIRRLEELYKQTKQTPSNRNFGVLQEVHSGTNGPIFQPSQGLPSFHSTTVQQPSFRILQDNETPSKSGPELPWSRFEESSVRSKENERVSEKWSEVRLRQNASSVKKTPLPFIIYNENTEKKPVSTERLLMKETKYFYNKVITRCPFGFKRELFIQGPYVGDELSFEEFRAKYYTVIPAGNQQNTQLSQPLKTPQKPFPRESEQSKNAADYMATSKQGMMNEDMTVNTRGVLNEMSDIFGNKDWSSKRETKPIFDILSTVKKSQKRTKDLPFSIYMPENADEDETADKENQPIPVSDPFSSQGNNRGEEEPSRKRRAVVEDIEMESTGSLTRRDSVVIQQLLSQSQSGRSSLATNRISDFDESAPFMNGTRDTADEGILMGVTDLYNKL